MDKVVYPVTYSFESGSGGVTSVSTLAETFDRSRAFRIASISGRLCAIKYPVMAQFRVFGPQSSADNVWASPYLMVPHSGPPCRFRYRIPVTSVGWYPSGSAATTQLMQLLGICNNKAYVGIIEGFCNITIHLRPYEPDNACPTLCANLPSFTQCARPILAPGSSASTSVEVLTSSSDEEEYFSAS